MANTNEWIMKIINGEKKTPLVAYVSGNQLPLEYEGLDIYGDEKNCTIFGDKKVLDVYFKDYADVITKSHVEYSARYSAVPLMDISGEHARIEPGAIIREGVTIGDNAVIMMGSIINIGAQIGEKTMIDMGAIVGGRAIVGANCHIGAGAVLAGVIEPPSATPVIIEDNVLIGANAVVVEGVRVGKGATVGAGSIVLKDVPAGAVVAGNPARIIKEQKDEKTIEKTELIEGLRDIHE